MSNWQLNDSAPASAAQGFDAAPNEQVEKYWGGPMSIAMPDQAAGTVHNGQASAVCAASASVAAKRVVAGSSSVSGTGITQATAKRVLKIALSSTGIATSQAAAKKILIASAPSSVVSTAAASAGRRTGGQATSSAAAGSSVTSRRVSMSIAASLANVSAALTAQKATSGSLQVQVAMVAVCIPSDNYEESPVEQPHVTPRQHTSFVGMNLSARTHKGKGKASLSGFRSTGKSSRVAASALHADLDSMSVSVQGGVSSAVERAWPKDESLAREWAFSKDENEALQVLTGLYEVADFNGR